jgi:3'-5' exoribonuclease
MLISMPRKLIKDFKQGETIEQILLITSKSLRNRTTGAPFGHLELRDKSGSINGKVWDNATALLESFKEGDFAQGRAQVNSYKNKLELVVNSLLFVSPKQVDLADFLPQSKKDIELLTEQLKESLASVKEPYLAKLLQTFIKDTQLIALLQKTPASIGHHQAYIGGLLEHTLCIIKMARSIAPEYPLVNPDLLITGAFLHDIGKVREYALKTHFDKTIEGRLIGHIALGLEMLTEKIGSIKDFPENLALQLKHLILSHHGELELGSPILPMTLEALVLHYLDNLDAKVSVRLTALENSSATDSDWAEVWEDGGKRRIYKQPTGETSPNLF